MTRYRDSFWPRLLLMVVVVMMMVMMIIFVVVLCEPQLLEQMRKVETVLESALVLRDQAEGAPEEPPIVPAEEELFCEASLGVVATKDHSKGKEKGGGTTESPFVTDNPVRSSSVGAEQRNTSSRRRGGSERRPESTQVRQYLAGSSTLAASR